MFGKRKDNVMEIMATAAVATTFCATAAMAPYVTKGIARGISGMNFKKRKKVRKTAEDVSGILTVDEVLRENAATPKARMQSACAPLMFDMSEGIAATNESNDLKAATVSTDTDIKTGSIEIPNAETIDAEIPAAVMLAEEPPAETAAEAPDEAESETPAAVMQAEETADVTDTETPDETEPETFTETAAETPDEAEPETPAVVMQAEETADVTETETSDEAEPEAPAATGPEEVAKLLRRQNHLLIGIFAMVGGMFLVAFISALLIVPHVLNILTEGEKTVAQVQETITTVQDEIERLKDVEKIVADMSKVSTDIAQADIPGLISKTETLVDQSGDGIADAVTKLDSIDIESLNSAIKDLQSVVEPMAKMFGRR